METVVYLGSRGGGALDTYELLRGLSQIKPARYTAVVSNRNPMLDKLSQLPLKQLVTVKTSAPSNIALALASLLGRWWKVLRVISSTEPQVILVTMLHPWLCLLPVYLRIFLPKTKLVYVRHNPPFFENIDGFANKLLSKTDDSLTRRAHRVFTFSEFVRQEIVSARLVSSHATINIGFGLHCAFREATPQWTHSGFMPGDTLRVLFFGRILPYKGVDVLLQALEALVHRKVPIQLTIAGQGDLSHLQQKIDHLGSSIVLKNDWISDDETRNLFSNADVLVAPYVCASQSGPVNLAVTFNIPAIVTDAGGLAEFVEDGETGFVVAKSNPLMLAERLQFLAENKPCLLTMSCKTKELGKERTWYHVAKRATAALGKLRLEER